jgi:hypothetical protein
VIDNPSPGISTRDHLVKHLSLATPRSFAAKGFYGVSEGRADGLNTDRQQGNGEGNGTGHEEYPPADLRSIGKRLEPFVHGPPRDGEGDERSDPDKHGEVLAEEADDTRDWCAEDLADPDLFCALFGGIGNEAEEAEAGDEDGEDREGDEDLAALLLGVIELVEIIIHERIVERDIWPDGVKLGFYLTDEAEDVIGLKSGGDGAKVLIVPCIYIEDKGVDGIVHGIVVEILYDADHVKSALFDFFFGRPPQLHI